MIEYEGNPVFLSNPQDKIKHLMRVANEKDNRIRELGSQLEETTRLLEEAKARISRLVGDCIKKGTKKKGPKIRKNWVPPSGES